MMGTWIKQRLGNLIDINSDTVKKNYPHRDIEYVDISSVGTGCLNEVYLMPFVNAPSRAKRVAQHGDTILSTVRPNRRSFLYVKNPPDNRIFSTGFAILHPRKIDSRFLYYVISQQNFTDYLAKNAKGAAYPAVDEETICRAEITMPDLPTQSRIASVLSAYDDLIEVNEKRIKILEEMAQRLYMEWFVKFKFPGHEKSRMVPVETGLKPNNVETGLKPVSTKNDLIPEGWEVKTLGDKLNILKGKNITKNTIVDGKIPVVAGGLSPAYYHNKANTKNPVITLSASGANAGFVNLYQEEIWASDCSYVDNNATPFVYFYYLFLKNKQIEISKLQRGSAQPHVYPKDLMRLLILDIPEILMFNFECKVKQVFDAIKNLNKQNQKLSSIRNLLIPQLVTGKRGLK